MKKKTHIFIFIGAMVAVFFASYSLSGLFTDNHNAKTSTTKKVSTADISPSPNNTNAEKTKDDQPSQEASSPEKKSEAMEFYKILGVSNKLSEKDKAAMAVWRDKIVNLAKKNVGTMFINGSQNKKMVALTFDDGPDNNITPKILDVLKQNNVKGNFFFIGQQVGQNKDVVKRAFSEGNLVLSHSFTHPDFSTKTEGDIDKEIKDTENAIYNVIGKKPALIRPPYGETNDAVLKEAARNNLKIIIWSIDTLDWSQREKDNITKNVLDNVRPGEIILMHSNGDKKATLEALPDIINGLKDKGYSIVTLSEMLGVNAYKD